VYKIIVCYNCGRLLLAESEQRTRLCPHCEATINTKRTRVVAAAATAREASELIRAFKQKKEYDGSQGQRR